MLGQDGSVIKIQASIRGFFARQKYQIKNNPLDLCTNYDLRLVGNDPAIYNLPSHEPQHQVVLIGTSGLRTLEIACQLGSDLPKIFLIDNSKKVILFWKNLQCIMESASSAKGILQQLVPLNCPCEACIRSIDDDTGYLSFLCQMHGFDKVKRIIMHASIISQDWAHSKTFLSIKNIIKYHDYSSVYVYASNIVAYVARANPENARKILKNIEDLNPDLAIHTDLPRLKPENVFYYSKNNHEVEKIFSNLGGNHLQKNAFISLRLGRLVLNKIDDFDEENEDANMSFKG